MTNSKELDFTELLMNYGLLRFDPENDANELNFELVRKRVAYFNYMDYKEALECYEKVPEKLRKHVYMTTGSTPLVIYDCKYFMFNIEFSFDMHAKRLEEFYDKFSEEREAEHVLALANTPYKIMVLKVLLAQDLIPKERKRELLLDVYTLTEYQFDSEYEFFVNELSTSINFEDIDLLKSSKNVTDNDTLTIYRVQASKSTPYENSLSWTLDYDTAMMFYNRFGKPDKLYSAEVKVSDVLAYINGPEEEILVTSDKLANVTEIQPSN